MSDDDTRYDAVLLLGPTGSGKTPLGDLFEKNGWRGRRCLHFDFGANLRSIAERGTANNHVSQTDVDFIRRVLREGILLEDEHFPLARRVFHEFLARRQKQIDERIDRPQQHDDTVKQQRPLVILNGLPRHVGQAEAMAAIVEVVAVVYLRCSSASVLARIRGNAGGDRDGREDDDMAAVSRKMQIFQERTRPLLAYYRQQGININEVDVDATTTPMDVWGRVTCGGLQMQQRGGPKLHSEGQ